MEVNKDNHKLEGQKDNLLERGQEMERFKAEMDSILEPLGKRAKVDPKVLDSSSLESD